MKVGIAKETWRIGESEQKSPDSMGTSLETA